MPSASTITAATSVNGATGVATTPLLRWADGNAAIYYYELQLSRDGDRTLSEQLAAHYAALIRQRLLATDGIAAFTPEDRAAGLAYMERMYGATSATVDEILAA